MNRSKAEKLMNTESIDFIKLARLMTEEKQINAKFIKITREQLRNHLIKVIISRCVIISLEISI